MKSFEVAGSATAAFFFLITPYKTTNAIYKGSICSNTFHTFHLFPPSRVSCLMMFAVRSKGKNGALRSAVGTGEPEPHQARVPLRSGALEDPSGLTAPEEFLRKTREARRKVPSGPHVEVDMLFHVLTACSASKGRFSGFSDLMCSDSFRHVGEDAAEDGPIPLSHRCLWSHQPSSFLVRHGGADVCIRPG